MGNCFGPQISDAVRLEKATAKDHAVMLGFMKLQLMTQEEMNKIYAAFDHIGPPVEGGVSGTGVISMEDSFHYLFGSRYEEEVSLFLDQVFTAPKKLRYEYRLQRYGEERPMNTGIAPQMSFQDWSLAIWLLTKFELSTLAFNIFDTDGSGALDMSEVEKIVAEIYSTSSARAGREINVTSRPIDDRATQILEGMDVNGDGKVTKEEFVLMVKNYHHLMMPAFTLQRKVREKIFGFGNVNWDEEEGKRRNQSKTGMIDIISEIDHIVEGSKKDFEKKTVINEKYSGNILSDTLDRDATTHNETKYLKDEAKENREFVDLHREHRVLKIAEE